jgi:cyanobactin maturation PatA/PatG family protease
MPGRAVHFSGDPRIRVAVLDGPVDLAHPCFAGARLELPLGQPAFDPGSAAARHGTHVASIIFGQPGGGVEGIAPGCTGLVIPIFRDRGDGSLACSQLDLARALLAAIENGAHIINVSGGQLSPSGAAEPMLAQAIERCTRRNVLIVAAAGNDGCDCLHVPAAAPSVLAVGAMGKDGAPLDSSNYGGAYLAQGLLAPGEEVPGAAPGAGIARRTGTSYATPYVTGQAALLASLQLAGGRAPDPAAIRAALLATAHPCLETDGDCRRLLAGRIDIPKATAQIQGGIAMTDAFTLPHAGADGPRAAPAVELQPQGLDFAPRSAWTPPAFAASPSAGAIRPSDAPALAAERPGPGEGSIEPSDCGCGCGGKGKDKAAGAGGDCGCGCGGAKSGGAAPKKPQLVYALGTLGYDFGSEARRDSLAQSMPGDASPLSPEAFLAHLDENPWDAASVIWTLNLDATPIYAVHPAGAFAEAGFKMLRDAFAAQLREGADIVSIPGVIGGSMTLESGQTVPIIIPAIRGIHYWATEPLVTHVMGARPSAAAEQGGYDRMTEGLSNFLGRVYYDLRNLGITGEERALNYSATNAIQIAAVIQRTTTENLELDTISVKRSPVCRPDSECYDVELAFFNPNNTNMADRVHRFTVDVSDVVPVTIGAVRTWARRA